MNVSSHLSDKHLKDEDAKAPPVDGTGVRWFRENLWSQEFRSATERGRPVSETHSFLAQTEVGNLDEALDIQQQIIKFQVP